MLQSLVNRLRDARKEAGDRLGEMLAVASVRERATAVADKIEDLQLELARRLRGGTPATMPAAAKSRSAAKARGTATRAAAATRKAAARPAAGARARAAAKPAPAGQPLQNMTVQELHQLASSRHIAGRSAMNKAQLVNALRQE
jgi:hypothetical protein